MAGPAATLWAARFPDRPSSPTLPASLDGIATVLSGTGWQSSLEHDARGLARQAGVRSIALIDYWVNYRDRFRFDSEELLPDTIWVADPDAFALATAQFPELPIVLRPNLYLQEQATAAGPCPPDRDVLFVAEPARDGWGAGVPGEFQALDYFITHRDMAGVAQSVSLRVRPHPSEPVGKYDGWIAAHPGSGLDRSVDMAHALAAARWSLDCRVSGSWWLWRRGAPRSRRCRRTHRPVPCPTPI